MTDSFTVGLFTPGAGRARGLLDDAALVAAMVRVEVAWTRALARTGVVSDVEAEAVASAVSAWCPELDADDVEAGGNPVIPLVKVMREHVGEVVGQEAAERLHRGLTSQDVLDSALVLLAVDAGERIAADLERIADALARLATEHRDSVQAGRTLTQFAVPVTFGLTAAQWLTGVLDTADELRRRITALPAQCGGAAGTLSLLTVVAGDDAQTALECREAFAAELGLAVSAVPWHTRRAVVTGLGDALVQTCDALGVIAADVLTLSRPEVAEVSEGAAPGRGGSSTMPHKRNPVLSVLVNSAALQAPQLGATLHLASARAVDQRPEGAWHAEWPTLARLVEITVVAASQAADLVENLTVDTEAMARRAVAASDDLLAEYRSAASAAGQRSLSRDERSVPRDGPLPHVTSSHESRGTWGERAASSGESSGARGEVVASSEEPGTSCAAALTDQPDVRFENVPGAQPPKARRRHGGDPGAGDARGQADEARAQTASREGPASRALRDLAGYLGAAREFTDAALARHSARAESRGER